MNESGCAIRPSRSRSKQKKKYGGHLTSGPVDLTYPLLVEKLFYWREPLLPAEASASFITASSLFRPRRSVAVRIDGVFELTTCL